MDTKNGTSNSNTDSLKPKLSSTKSVDEGFESDPDRELSTDSENGGNKLLLMNRSSNRDFDVLQRTDRDGVQHTQITRRKDTDCTEPTGTISANHLRRMKASIANAETNKNRSTNLYQAVLAKPKVTIPRAGQRISVNGNPPPTSMQYTNLASKPNAHNKPTSNDYRRVQVKSGIILPNNVESTSNNTRNLIIDPIRHRDSRLNINGDIQPRNELLMGKLVCLNMSTPQQQHLTTRPFYNVSNQSKSTRPHTNPLMQNPSSMHTFYPAEGDISIYPSHYGLKYKSTHLINGQEHQAPITMWTQSIPRQTRR